MQEFSRPPRGVTWALGALTAMGAAAIDSYLPSLPAIDQELVTGSITAQHSLSAFFLGLAIGQLFYGPLSDRFGRRRVMFVGVSLYIFASLACAFASSIELLLFGRFLQALAAGVGSVIGRAVVRDLYHMDQAAQAQSFIQMVFLITPLLAPTFGGYIMLWFDWRVIFVVLAIFGATCLVALATQIPETLPVERRQPLNPKAVFTAYGHVFRHRQSLGAILTGAFGFACMFTYFAESALVFTRVYDVAVEDYGLFFALNVIGLMVTNFINIRMVARIGALTMLLIGVVMIWAGAMALLVTAVTGFGGLWGLVLPLILVVGSLGLVGANAAAAALAPFGKRAGTASSLQGFIQMAIGAAAATIVGFFHDGSALPMALTIAGLASLGLLCRLFLVGFKHPPEPAD